MAKQGTNGQQDTKVITGEVRLSYVHLFQPYAQKEDDDKKYSVMLLIPKSDKKTLKKLRAAEKVALENGRSTKFKGKIPANPSSIIHDCDEEDDLEEHPEREGHYRMSVSSTEAPGVVDRRTQPILDSTEVYSGCYAYASVNAFPYNTNGNKGVSFGLNHIMKVADGDPLGGRSRAEDDFADVEFEDDEDEGLI